MRNKELKPFVWEGIELFYFAFASYGNGNSYLIGNYIYIVGEIAYRLTRNLKKYLAGSEVNILRIALREMIFNAIEHIDQKSGAKAMKSAFRG